MPDPESLRCFLAAAREANFRAAARVVALSPAAFGQRIRQLEDELGVQLFERTTRSVMLTEAALRLRPYAERALSALDACVHAASTEGMLPPVELVIGTRHELGLSWLLPMLRDFETILPTLTAHLYFGSGDDLLARVRASDIDCAVTSTRSTDSKLDFIRLHEERYVFVGCRELLRRKPFASPEDAAEHVLFDTGASMPLFRYWRDAQGGVDSIAFAQVRRLGTIAAIAHGVREGLGVAVLPLYYVEDELARGELVNILPNVKPSSDHFRFIYRTEDPRRGIYRVLADAMLKVPLK